MSDDRNRARERWLTLLLAVGLDLARGEPPVARHPVVWLGSLIGRLERTASQRLAADDRGGQVLAGLAIEVGTLLAAALPMAVAQRLLDAAPPAARVLGGAILLKPAFAVRALFAAVAAVEAPLVAGNIEDARAALAQIVSRDVATLDVPLIAAAAIESLTENLSDSVVAPLLAFRLGGLPLAYAYRAVNTLDSMLGYHGRFEYLGKPAARLDDLVNVVPARLTALLLTWAAPVVGTRPGRVLWVTRREQRRTTSPNAGWPMAAAAAALNCCLEKRGHYRLNPAAAAPRPADLARARRLALTALALAI